ncbi:MAG: adenylate/guanylate cyclase domain-containing protein [Proteobacteria bacterium]|nr:adenylate/guanylate cyclase domain-containing protein [Pseudomonadota bacterium]
MLPDALKDIADWLVDGARSAPTPTEMMAQTCERLVAAGLPLWRVGVFIQTLHPDIFGRNFIWRPGADVVVGTAGFDIQDSAEFRNSPLAILYEKRQEVRYRLDDPESKRFPFFDDMREEGVTDYIALPLLYVDGSVHASSWTTKQPGGFSDAHLAALRQLVPPLARLIEVIGLRRTATILLDTYVGNRAGERILAGQIRRGHTETMNAVIWLSDLRGFTRLSDRLPSEIVVDILNRYFDCQVAAIRKRGGEVLKFMGDGLLAVFPVTGDNAAVICDQVLEAVHDCRASVADLVYSEGGHTVERFRFGLALHIGTVLYGNIGGGNRLDFTCIGPAVNLAARLEKIAGSLQRTVVASAGFAELCASGDWADLGEFPIAGFAKAERVFGLSDETPVTSG